MIIEIDKHYMNKMNLQNQNGITAAIKAGMFTVWTSERIKGAFSNGHGTMKDFERYKRDNARYCTIVELSEKTVYGLYPELIIPQF